MMFVARPWVCFEAGRLAQTQSSAMGGKNSKGGKWMSGRMGSCGPLEKIKKMGGMKG